MVGEQYSASSVRVHEVQCTHDQYAPGDSMLQVHVHLTFIPVLLLSVSLVADLIYSQHC